MFPPSGKEPKACRVTCGRVPLIDLHRQHRNRAVVLIVFVVLVAVLAASDTLHARIRSLVDTAAVVIKDHPVAGAIVFVLLSAASAMVVFFSTAVITPIAVDAYGAVVALLLLWLGWILGGMAAFAIGRRLGHRVVAWFVKPERLRRYEERASRLATFRHIFFFQLSVPSEIPGYVLGLAGARFRTYLGAMALAELPFAIGAVYLGESFLRRNYLLVLAIGLAGIVFTWLAFRHAAREFH